MKRAFMVKQNAFIIISKWFSVTKAYLIPNQNTFPSEIKYHVFYDLDFVKLLIAIISSENLHIYQANFTGSLSYILIIGKQPPRGALQDVYYSVMKLLYICGPNS